MIDLLWSVGHDLLDAAADTLAAAGLTVPGRQFVDVGTAATAPVNLQGGCVDQLTVVVLGPGNLQPPLASAAQPATARGVPAIVWKVQLNLSLIRCHAPAGTALPAPAVLDEAAKVWLRDGWQLARGLAYLWKTKQLLPSLGPEPQDHSIRLGDFTPVGPTGGVAGWVLPVSALVSDLYDPANPA